MRHDVFEELRAENPVPEALAPPPLERLLARLDEEPLADRRKRPKPGLRWRRAWAVGLPVSAAVAVAIAIGAVALLRGGPEPTPTTKPTGPTTIQQLVDILAVLRRPQTTADRALPDQGRPSLAVNAGAPDLALARLATVTPWGQKVFIAPMKPLSRSAVTQLEHRYPGLARDFEGQPAPRVTLALFGTQEINFGSVSDIENGREEVFEGAHGILGLAGQGPPTRVVMVIPDGVAKVVFVLPRQANPGAIAYPNTETITVPVHNNVAAFETDRYINEDHLNSIGMTWYAPSGAIVKRIGNFHQLNGVRPDPTLTLAVRTQNPSRWDSLAVVPSAGSQSTTFTMAFRRPVSGAYRYAFRFRGPGAVSGCSSPVSQTPIVRGPDLGIPSTRRGQIASTQFSAQAWCPGTYHVSVALAAGGYRPFSTASFTVQP